MKTQDLTAEDLEDFFEEKSEKYVLFWENTYKRQQPKKMGMYFWHWPALVLGPIWMCYRKLYWQAIAFSVGIAALVIVMEELFAFQFPSFISGVISANLAYPLAIWGALSDIKKINAQNLSADERQEQIRLKGGTSRVAAGVAAVIIIAFVVLGTLASQ